MDSNLRILANPHLWALLSAVCLGAALNRAIRPASHPRWRAAEPDKARTAKWTFFTLYLTLALAAALAALLVSGAAWVGNRLLLYLYLGAVLVSFLAFRFKKSVGSVIVLLAVALAVTVLLFFRSLAPFTGETEIGRVRVLAARAEQMRLELLLPGAESQIVELGGAYFAPVVKVVVFDDAFVFLGAKSWYRFEEMKGFDRDLKERPPGVRLFQPAGISERLWRLFERYDNRIPGVRSAQVEIVLKKPARELASYALRIQNDGGLQVIDAR